MTSGGSEEKRIIIKLLYNAGKTATEIKKIMDMAGDAHRVSKSLVHKWHKRFQEGFMSTKDEKRPGRPRTIDILTIDAVRREMNVDRRLTVREISDRFNISVSSAHSIMTKELGLERVSARWVPRLLIHDEMEKRVTASRAFIRKWRVAGDAFLKRIITTDETWLHYYDPETKQQSSVWKTKESPPRKRQRLQNLRQSICLLCLWIEMEYSCHM